jgi:putative addiction module component (TIGR02574 family)
MAILAQDQIDQMSPEDRVELIGVLWDSLEKPMPLSAAQHDELAVRLAALDAAETVRWADLHAELAARLP